MIFGAPFKPFVLEHRLHTTARVIQSKPVSSFGFML